MKDNFSTQARSYAQFRPTYPDDLFRELYSHLQSFDRAWDCGTGNGQVAVVLAQKFQSVIATDISEKQLSNAIMRPNITYCNEMAEAADFPSEFFDLITVAQAVHWFDFDKFYTSVNRVLKQNGIIAIIGYGLLRFGDPKDNIIQSLYEDILGEYWDPERRYIDEYYQTIPFPFEELKMQAFTQTYDWSLKQLLGYLNTWSAVQHFHQKNGENPVDIIVPDLRVSWGESSTKPVMFPILMRVGKK